MSLIPRKVLFGNPDKASLKISHDGKFLSFLAPLEGVLNIWVTRREDPHHPQPVTRDTGRGIRSYFWAYDGRHIIYMQDEDGDENWQIHAVDATTEQDRNLTPFSEIPGPDGEPLTLPNGRKLRPAAYVLKVSHKFPNEILIGLNNRNPEFHDIHRLHIESGQLALIQQNDGFTGFLSDDDYRIRFASRMTPAGGSQLLQPVGPDEWETFLEIPQEDMLTTHPVGFDKSNQVLFLLDSRGRDTAALNSLDLDNGRLQTLAESEAADINAVLIHPKERTIQAASSEYERVNWLILDPAVKEHFAALQQVCAGDLNVTNRSFDDQFWIVAFTQAHGPVRYYLYDSSSRKATFLFTNRAALERLKLAPMQPLVLKSRDDLNLVNYLTLPGLDGPRPDRPLPLVLYVHGGPWARDSWVYDPIHQWLANRGYAVLSVNFRGSTGFGKNFINAANREWGAKMHDDLIDAVNWVVREKIADPSRIGIMGGSYGGFATLVGLTLTPDTFACGVDIVGPSNLRTLLETIPPYWKPLMDMWAVRVGDPRTEEGARFLDSRSPLSSVDRIRKPLLIGQGANDPRVKQSESDQIVKAMTEKQIPVTYVVYDDEGHGFARPENSISFFAVAENFLALHLGGQAEAIGGDFADSSLKIAAGADQIPGLEGALAAISLP